MTTDNTTPPPRKTLTLKLNANAPIPEQLQEKLKQIKETYLAPPLPKKPVPPKKKKVTPPPVKEVPLTKAEKKQKKKEEDRLAREAAKKAIAIRHEKEQKAIQEQAQQLRFNKMKEALAWLQETYPLCFNMFEPKPLKLHIEKDILSELPEGLTFSRVHVREALGYYSRRPKYRATLSQATHRYNLQGEAVEEVIPDHQQIAATKLALHMERREKMKAEKKAKYEAWLERKKKREDFLLKKKKKNGTMALKNPTSELKGDKIKEE